MDLHKKKQLYTRREVEKIVDKMVDETVKTILESKQGYKGVKCTVCGKQIGCPYCGQVLPEIEVVIQDEEDQSKFYCSFECIERKPDKKETKSHPQRRSRRARVQV